MPFDNSTTRQPANGAPRRATFSCPVWCAPRGRRSRWPRRSADVARLCLRANVRHPRPRVAVTLAGLVADVRDHVDVGGLRRADSQRGRAPSGCSANGSNEYAAIAFSWVILLMTASSRWPIVSMTSSGANGQLLSECGKSDSQHNMSSLNQSMFFTPTLSLMKQV